MLDTMCQDLIKATFRIYREIDRNVSLFQLANDFRCPPRCGICCESQKVESTVLECLPLANIICRRKEEERILVAIDKKVAKNDSSCVSYRPDEAVAGFGECAHIIIIAPWFVGSLDLHLGGGNSASGNFAYAG